MCQNLTSVSELSEECALELSESVYVPELSEKMLGLNRKAREEVYYKAEDGS
jgi:hypothetical protein